MALISNEDLVDLIIPGNERYDTIDARFSKFQLNLDATIENFNKAHGKLCLRFHIDKSKYPCSSKAMKVLN